MLADVGIPMIFVQWPLMIGALIPVIIIEALFIRRWVKVTPKDAFKGVTVANLLSTLAGFPLTWLAMFIIELIILLPLGMAADHWHWDFQDSPFFQVISFVVGMAWIGPVESYWLAPLAAAMLLIPSFWVSVWLESKVCRRMWPNMDPIIVRQGVFRANLASYILLFILACGWAGIEFYIH